MLYHKQVFWPARLDAKLPKGRIHLVYSNHAVAAAHTDRYGKVSLPHTIDANQVFWFEAEEINPELPLQKAVGRIDVGNGLSMALVLSPDRFTKGSFFVRTVWYNKTTDKHKTLRKEAYCSK